jgi:hypothetical protein
MDGQQKCHAFPLAARNAFHGKVLIFSGHAFESKKGPSSTVLHYHYQYGIV